MHLRVLDQDGHEYTNVTYMSSDSSIATVEQGGLVTASEKEGSCRITAYSNEDASLRASIDITVEYIGNIILYTANNDTNVGIGNSLGLVCCKYPSSGDSIIPYTNVTYSVSDSELAEVIDNRLVGKSVGSVAVVAVDNENKTIRTGHLVNIVEQAADSGASVGSTSRLIAFYPSNDDTLQANSNYALYIIKDGQSLYYNVTFSIDNTEIVEMVGSTSIHCKSPGTATITITDKADTSISTALTINVVE